MGKTAKKMKHSNNSVSKAHALGLYTYLVMNTTLHTTMSVDDSSAEVCIFVHSLGELVALESEIAPFLTDGTKTKTRYFEELNAYSYEIEYPMVFLNGR